MAWSYPVAAGSQLCKSSALLQHCPVSFLWCCQDCWRPQPPALTVAGVKTVFDIFCHVQDLPGALNDAAVAEGLNLHSIKNRDWAIFKTSAIKGEGLFEGLDWLSNQLKTKKR